MLRGAADEVLGVLKNSGLKDPEKQTGVEELLGPLAADKFSQLVAIGKLITDWVRDGCMHMCVCVCIMGGHWLLAHMRHAHTHNHAHTCNLSWVLVFSLGRNPCNSRMHTPYSIVYTHVRNTHICWCLQPIKG